MPYLGTFGLEFEKAIVTSEISTLEFLKNDVLTHKKQKCLNLGPKIPNFGTFGLEFGKAFVISEISTLKFLKNESLTHTMNFGIRSAFSKGLGSGFSEGPGPGLGPLCKVCHLNDSLSFIF